MDVQWSVILARYGEPWRLRRKVVERSFRPASLAAYRGLQEARARVLATRLLQNPQEWTAHVELSGFSLIYSILCLSIIIHIISQLPRRAAACHDIWL